MAGLPEDPKARRARLFISAPGAAVLGISLANLVLTSAWWGIGVLVGGTAFLVGKRLENEHQ
jgi:predicted small integral membrane protein